MVSLLRNYFVARFFETLERKRIGRRQPAREGDDSRLIGNLKQFANLRTADPFGS
jgi:hypothetical protein